MAMKREDRDKWVAALRSGEYRQCTEWLKDQDGFCCLGVAADLLVEPYEGQKWTTTPSLGVWYLRDGHSGFHARYWYPPGLSQEHGGELADMNDEGCTFTEIADWIEQNVEVEPS